MYHLKLTRILVKTFSLYTKQPIELSTKPFSSSDNAYDPDVNATQLKIDIVDIEGMKCLTFLDNGAGMSPHTLYKMLSFGFCDKVRVITCSCRDIVSVVKITLFTESLRLLAYLMTGPILISPMLIHVSTH